MPSTEQPESQNMSKQALSDQTFAQISSRPRMLLIASFILIFGFGLGIKGVVKDPSVDAFVPADHPAALARAVATETFGLEDPIVVGLVAPAGTSAFTPAALEALRRIEAQVRILPNVKKNDLISVVSESAVQGSNGDLLVEPIVEPGPVTNVSARTAWERLQSMPMMTGLLASTNGDTLTLIIPVRNSNTAGATYQQIKTLVTTETPAPYQGMVTGVASMNGRLAEMVNQDTRFFIPVAVCMALLILFIALRRLVALTGPLLVIAGSAAIAIGLMGWLDARYYLITTALPVIIMGIAIADSLHISLMYLRERERHPDLTSADAVQRALAHTFVPVSLTSITTVCGFSGLALGSPMQPIAEFGWFAACGVLAAWTLSLTLLPAVLVLTDLKPKQGGIIIKTSRLDHWVMQITRQSFAHPWRYSGAVLASLVLFAVAATGAQFDYERQRYFQPDEPVRVADVTLNQRLAGLNFLDVIVTSPEPAGLLTPTAISAIAELKNRLSQQPLVAKVTGIDQYISLLHSALTDAPLGALPQKDQAVAQYLLLYEVSGDPGDFKEEIDYDYQKALIRAQLTTDRYSNTRPTVAQFEKITHQWSAETGLQAAVSGRVAVNAGWMDLLAASHFQSLGIALLLVLLASFCVFRSFWAASLTLVPVLTGVLFTYAAMGFFNVDIAPATSMTAAIATGLGVDFAIHLLAELRRAEADGSQGINAFHGRYALVARACIYSAIALGCALAVICLSATPPLRWFGGLVAAASIGSLVGAIIILPALFALGNRRSTTDALTKNESTRQLETQSL